MQFSRLASIAALFAGAIATPIEGEIKLERRATEGIHLVNCGNNVYSVVVYCSDDSNCAHNPSSANQCDKPGGGVFTWEGGSKSCTFNTGTTFTWSISSNGQTQPNFSQVGTGTNGFHNFNIFKDDKHTMYTDGNGNACRSIYYCLDQ